MEILKFLKNTVFTETLFVIQGSMYDTFDQIYPGLGLNYELGKKKLIYFYILITSYHILCHFTSLIGHFILASVKRSKTIDLLGFQFQHPNDSKLKLYSYFMKRTQGLSIEYIPSIRKNYISNNIFKIYIYNYSYKYLKENILRDLFPKGIGYIPFQFFFFYFSMIDSSLESIGARFNDGQEYGKRRANISFVNHVVTLLLILLSIISRKLDQQFLGWK